MIKFFKSVLAVVVGVFIASWIMLFGFIAIMSVIAMQDKEKIEDGSLLVLKFDDEYKDFATKTIFMGIEYQDNNGINQVVEAIKHAQTDTKIKGISIKHADGISGITHLKQLRKALEEFKKSGKFVYAFNESISQADYYLQSVADSLFLGTLGDVNLRGFATEIMYFKEFQEKFGVKMEVIRHGKYKSAVEPFLQGKMSEENREQIQAFLSSMWKNFAQTIAESRSIPIEQFNALTDSLAGRTAEAALEKGLVDGVMFYDQYKEKLAKAMGVSKPDDIKSIGIKQYIEHLQSSKIPKANVQKAQIAVLHIDGAIMEGAASEGIAGSETLCATLEELRKDENVKAVVLRVNSPGGSGSASEFIHREIELTKKVKPVYTSMGNYAASGGYYVACNSNHIFAENETITGSIGVFAMLPSAASLTEKLGIATEQVTTHTNSIAYSPFRSITEQQKKIFTESVEDFYKKFIGRVSEGRGISLQATEAIAQGRVWTGEDAQKKGLVDTIGSLDDAIAYAAQKAEIQDYAVEHYPNFEIEIEDIISKKMPFSVLQKTLLGEQTNELLNQIKATQQQEGLWAKMPFELKY